MLREHTAASHDLRSAALAGLSAYQAAPRRDPRSMPPPIAMAGRAMLRDYGGSGRPVVFVPSLINPPFILDLAPDVSPIRWLAGRGHRCLLVDWGSPSPADHKADLDAHVESMLLPLLASLGEPPVVIGYCLGGTIALAAAMLRPVAGLATIAAPWRFDGYGQARASIADLWRSARPTCERLGIVPMEVLQSGFWQLDPARTVDKYARFGTLDVKSEAARRFIALEDWANEGAPLTLGVGRQLFDRMIGTDEPGRGEWKIGDMKIDPARLTCPAIEFVSANDRIVPAASAARLPDSRLLHAGHVGMIVGSRSREQLWALLDNWLSGIDVPR